MPILQEVVNATKDNIPNSVVRRGPTGDFVAGIITGNLNGRASIAETFEFEQVVPDAIWTISHNLNKFPSITVIDSSGNKVYGKEEYIDSNQVRITFSGAFAGRAYLN